MFLGKLANRKEIELIANKILNLSSDFKKIVSENCAKYGYNIDMEELEISAFMYNLFFYTQVMKVKYSKAFIDMSINTILYNIEDSAKKMENPIPKKYFHNIFKKLSNSLSEIHKISEQNDVDPLYMVSMYYCSDELRLGEEELEEDSILVDRITNHFQSIMNLSIEEI